MNVCGWPTSLVAFGAIAIFAFTHRFVADAGVAVDRVAMARERETAHRCDRVGADDVHPGGVRDEADRAVARTARDRAGVRGREPARTGMEEEGDQRPVGSIRQPVPSFTFTCPVNTCVCADPVHAVRRDLDVRVDDPERLTSAVRTLVDGIALVVRLERAEPGRVHREGEAGRVEMAARVERADAPGVRRRRTGASPRSGTNRCSRSRSEPAARADLSP